MLSTLREAITPVAKNTAVRFETVVRREPMSFTPWEAMARMFETVVPVESPTQTPG